MNQKPERVFRIGQVSASVFARDIAQGETSRLVRNVSVQKRYTADGETKFTTSFGLGELPLVIRALQLAQSYIESEEAEVLQRP